MEKGVFHSYFYIIISFLASSNISQNNTKNLKKQWQEMQWRHKEEQRLLEQVAKLYQAEHVAQKARSKVEEKTQEEAERQRVVEEKKIMNRMIEYLQ